ncbi:hypothetical protein LCGC14_0480280 [marine sediment metagenome]|uniref:Glycosyl transferase family 1 domain-containing protein n=1 Tax=marine sediment metagenome TaxID=412755 RepID=A0A0F9S9I3_9ZZZZ|nr:glycosyltransferase [Methylophaga sp.]
MKNSKYKIAYLSFFDPNDKKSNSGIQYYMQTALHDNGNLVDLYWASGVLVRCGLKILHRIYSLSHNNAKEFYSWTPLYKFLGLYFSIRLFFSFKKYDFIFTSRGSHLIPYLKSKLPLIYTSDITFDLMVKYYNGFDNVSAKMKEEGDFKEHSTIQRSSLCIYPSKWAADSAIDYYNAEPNRVVVIPSGANFDINDIPASHIISANRSSKSICNILFVGRDWSVKGGDIAFNTVKILNEQGIRSTLTVIGCKPPFNDYPSWFKVIPNLDKNISEQNQVLSNYFVNSHIFLLPTRHEAFGLVFAEACAYGLPVMGTDTGGVPTIVVNDHNGYLFDLTDEAVVYADRIANIWKDETTYARLSHNARMHYEKVLNWKAWGERFQNEIQRVI